MTLYSVKILVSFHPLWYSNNVYFSCSAVCFQLPSSWRHNCPSLYAGSHADKDGREWYVPGLDFSLYGSPSSEGVGVAMRCGRWLRAYGSGSMYYSCSNWRRGSLTTEWKVEGRQWWRFGRTLSLGKQTHTFYFGKFNLLLSVLTPFCKCCHFFMNIIYKLELKIQFNQSKMENKWSILPHLHDQF